MLYTYTGRENENQVTKKDESLGRLFEYTKFHIGVYITLTGSYITLASVRDGACFLIPVYRPAMYLAIVTFLLAGFAGGVIVSSITQTTAASSKQFLDSRIGPWGFKYQHCFWRAEHWTWVEHTSFWAGLFAAIGSFVFASISCVTTSQI